MMNPCFDKIPAELKALRQWIVWNNVERKGQATKLPFQTNGKSAKSNDPQTWTDFATAAKCCRSFSGLGFMFADDPFCGIDLDGCRDPNTGLVAVWAKEVLQKFASYAEVSPSQTGVKIFCRGQSPFEAGRKTALSIDKVCDKNPAIEVYDRLRYFAVTGQRLQGMATISDGTAALAWLKEKYWPPDFYAEASVNDRARKYLAALPPAVSGQAGHNATFRAACILVLGFQIPEGEAMSLMLEFNARCSPPWTDKELLHKIRSAAHQPGERGYLRNSLPERWRSIRIPDYQEPREVRQTTLADATKAYFASVKQGQRVLIDSSIDELDYALGGGLQLGEMVIFASRPSHGKSMVALQCLHKWTQQGKSCMIVSEEMSALMLGRRSLQFVSWVPEDRWVLEAERVEAQIDGYQEALQRCMVVESCGTAEKACDVIRKAVTEKAVQCAVIDYAQLLRAPGKGRYEQVTNTSIMLRQLATDTKILLLVLCQLSRGIEARKGEFLPMLSDLRDTGQLEQDADVVVFLCWPHRIEPAEPIAKYQLFVAKNRNRAINKACVTCRIVPDRQMVNDGGVGFEKEVSENFNYEAK